MFRITRRDLEQGFEIARGNVTRASGDYEGQKPGVMSQIVKTGEIGGAAFLTGLLSGRFGPVAIGGSPVPVDLGVSALLHGGNILLNTGKLSPHISNVADGVFGAWSAKAGVGVGTKWRMKKGLPPVQVGPGPQAAGQLSAPSAPPPVARSRVPFTEVELRALVGEVK